MIAYNNIDDWCSERTRASQTNTECLTNCSHIEDWEYERTRASFKKTVDAGQVTFPTSISVFIVKYWRCNVSFGQWGVVSLQHGQVLASAHRI